MNNLLRLRFIVILISILILAACSPSTKEETTKDDIAPPTAEKVAKELTANGNTRIDNYYSIEAE